MGKKVFKKKSKRVPASLRYKVEKKVREHHRKMKKESKKRPKRFNKKVTCHVPNACPFKEDVLKEAEDRRIQKEREKEEYKLEMKEKKRLEKMNAKDKIKDLDKLVEDAESRADLFEMNSTSVDESEKNINSVTDRSAKAYYKEFRKVIESADVILEVLDSRDPLGSRSSQLEKAVLESSSNKRIILVLNKADLIPKENLTQWLKYLKNEFPTIAFKASTASSHQKFARAGNKDVLDSSEGLLKSSKCLGAEMLMNLLNNYCRNKDIKTSINVGIVGFPNVGKSSIINSLKRSKACKVGATAGVTTTMQTVQLDKKIRLIDCPGLVLADQGGEVPESAIALRNANKIESLKDPVTPVEAIIKRANKNQLLLHYRIEDFINHEDFLKKLAKRMGRLKKGGIPDMEATARRVLLDWNMGEIKYYTVPPEQNESLLDSEIVQEMSKEFDIDSLELMETEAISTLPDVLPHNTMQIDSEPITHVVLDNKENIELGENVKIVMAKKPGPSKFIEKLRKKAPQLEIEGNRQVNKMMKLTFKKQLKQRSRREKVATTLSDSLETAFQTMVSDDEDYDFGSDVI